MKRNSKAMVSIFLAILILPVYSFAIISIDTVKLFSAKNHLLNSNEIVMQSILSKYDRKLYEKYNIFAVSKDLDYLSDYTSFLLKENIDNNFSDFYRANLKGFVLETDENLKLINSQNLKKQILDYMKLKGVYNTGKGVFNLTKMVFDSKKYTEVMSKKLDYEESYSKFNSKLDKLSENIVYYADNYNLINENFFSLNSLLGKRKSEIKKVIDNFNKNKLASSSNTYKEDGASVQEIKKILKEWTKENEELWRNITLLSVKVEDIINSLKILSKDLNNIQAKLDLWNTEINKLDKSDIKSNFNSEYRLATEQFSKDNIDSLLKKFEEQSIVLSKILETLKNNVTLYSPDFTKIDDFMLSSYDLTNIKKLSSLGNYKIYKESLKNRNVAKKSNEEVKKAKSDKKIIEDFSKNHKDLTSIKNPKNIYNFINKKDIESLYNLQKAYIENINPSNSISNYKDIMGRTSSNIPDTNFDIIEKYYLAQYILEKFNDKFSDEEFSSQIEYILFGNDKFNNNISSVENLIFGIRFILNSIYAYTNSDLRIEATSIATAISGWTGFGIPIVRSLVLGGMSLGETILDVNDLNNKRAVNTYKNRSSWQVSVKGIGNLINKNLKDFANSSIDNIYSIIEDNSSKGIDYVSNSVDSFISQSVDGVIQAIMSDIVSPLYTTIMGSIEEDKEQISINIDKTIEDIENNIIKVNPFVDDLKTKALNIIKSKKAEILSIDLKNEIETLIKSVIAEIESLIKTKTNSLNIQFKNKINSILEKDKLEKKKLAQKYIDEYLSGFGVGKSDNIRGSMSGLNFRYNDYLMVVAMIRLISDESSILNRVAVLINADMKKDNPEFDLNKLSTKYILDTKIQINTMILNKYINLDEIQNSIVGGY